jgi:DNA-binding XRE family transcriptional regulator
MSWRLDALQAAREAVGLTRDELASRAGVNVQLIHVTEAPQTAGGTCSEADVDRIAGALGVTREALGAKDLG